jgi:cystathionine beta-lyase
MDFQAPACITNAVRRAADHGIFGYAGIPDSYYEAVGGWMRTRHGWEIEPEWVVFTPGVVPAIHLLIQTFSAPGDEVILQTPAYHPFFPAVRGNRRRVLATPLRITENRFTMDLDDLAARISPRTRMMLLCSPQNPGGRVWRPDELTALGELCRAHNVLVIADEIHADLVYPPARHTPYARLNPDNATNSVTCTGVSKTFNLPGLQVSNIVIPNPRLRRRFQRKVRSCGLGMPNGIGIAATEAAYREGAPWLDALLPYLKANVDFLCSYVAAYIPQIGVMPPEGTYLAWLDCRGIPVAPEAVHAFLLREAKVGLEDGRVFGGPELGFERINLACPRSVLEEALQRIEKAIRGLY